MILGPKKGGWGEGGKRKSPEEIARRREGRVEGESETVWRRAEGGVGLKGREATPPISLRVTVRTEGNASVPFPAFRPRRRTAEAVWAGFGVVRTRKTTSVHPSSFASTVVDPKSEGLSRSVIAWERG